MDDLIHEKSCHVFRNRGTFLRPEPLRILLTKTWHGCQNVARFYGIGSGFSFSKKSAIFTVSRI